MTTIPILDLTRARQRIEAPLRERWNKVLDSNAYIQGPEVKELECAFTGFLGARAVVGVANGTDALVIALRALRLDPGAEVLVPAFSFFATAEAVVLAGGVPVFCDIDAATYNLDPAELELDGPAEVRFEDPESSAAVVLRPRDWAEVYRRTVEDVVAGWRLALRREGIRYHAVRTDLPFGRALRDPRMQLGLGAHIHATRRLVEDQQVALRRQPLGQHDLLLIPSRE